MSANLSSFRLSRSLRFHASGFRRSRTRTAQPVEVIVVTTQVPLNQSLADGAINGEGTEPASVDAEMHRPAGHPQSGRHGHAFTPGSSSH